MPDLSLACFGATAPHEHDQSLLILLSEYTRSSRHLLLVTREGVHKELMLYVNLDVCLCVISSIHKIIPKMLQKVQIVFLVLF